MMLLPTPATRASLRSFWLLASLGLGVAAALTAPPIGGGVMSRLGAALAVAVAAAIPGWVRPYEVALPYRAWNAAARLFSRHAIRYVTAVCFWTVGIANSRGATTAHFEAAPARSSMWRHRGTQPADAYTNQYHAPAPARATRGSAPLRAWIRWSAPPLTWTLMPFVMLIRLLGTAEDATPPAAPHIYTLY